MLLSKIFSCARWQLDQLKYGGGDVDRNDDTAKHRSRRRPCRYFNKSGLAHMEMSIILLGSRSLAPGSLKAAFPLRRWRNTVDEAPVG